MEFIDIYADADISTMLRIWRRWAMPGEIIWITMKRIMSEFAADALEKQKRRGTVFHGRKMVHSAGRDAAGADILQTGTA